MEDSTAPQQKERKRSCDNNAFAKFVPFSPPFGLDGGEPHEAHHGHKRPRPNSEPSFSETITNYSISSLPKQSIGTKGALDFSPPSTSIKKLANIGSSPPSIDSKLSHIEYEKNDGKGCRIVSAGQCHWKEDQNQSELESVMSMAAEELSKRPRTGTTYKAIAGQQDCIMKRLKDLSNEEPRIDVGLEMADAAYLLKLMSFSKDEIELAGQKGHKGAMLLLQAEILRKKGQELISECQNLVRHTL